MGLLERMLVRSKINDDKQTHIFGRLGTWSQDADVITIMEDGSVWNNGSWKYSPEGRSDAHCHELQNALAKMKVTKPKVQGCLACERGINVNLGRKHTVECRQTTLHSLVTCSLWMVKFDADGKVLNRHEHDDDGDAETQNACDSLTSNLTNVQT